MKTYIKGAKYNFFGRFLTVKSKRPRVHDSFSIFNAIIYVLITGYKCRNLPDSYPPYNTAYYRFRFWKHNYSFHKILTCINSKVKPRILVIDNQSISDRDLPSNKRNGYDGHKHRKGRKRCILTDCSSRIHCVRY